MITIPDPPEVDPPPPPPPSPFVPLVASLNGGVPPFTDPNLPPVPPPPVPPAPPSHTTPSLKAAPPPPPPYVTDVPVIDALVTSLSFIATWLLAKKKIENWVFWIVVDAACVGVYIYKELYATILLFSVLTVLAFIGYYQWKKHLQCTIE